MLFTKMNEIIDEVSAEVAEREELIECIALALLSKKNLFILGDTGQGKSYAITVLESNRLCKVYLIFIGI